jgi:hypothetical protein
MCSEVCHCVVLYVSLTIRILDIIHWPVFYVEHNFRLFLCLQVEFTQMGPIETARLCLWDQFGNRD